MEMENGMEYMYGMEYGMEYDTARYSFQFTIMELSKKEVWKGD
jgi:hypothetical protein